MSIEDSNEIHQAVFGYSNGHRLLASSLLLSPIDVYELAAASDLAPGVKLSGSESYITGISLPESRFYALIRTWTAPEMKRPGCVWSHVLLLSRQVLSSQLDLSVLDSLFVRPSNRELNEEYRNSLSVKRRARGQVAEIGLVERLLLSCYQNFALDIAYCKGVEFESAIFAVWSQQWPKLRADFSFRSVATERKLLSQSFFFQKDMSSTLVDRPYWLRATAEDAVSETVSPLRRFLWRYGKDVENPKSAFVDLVRIFMETRKRPPKFEDANQIVNRFRGRQAQTLKRDLLGFSANKLSLIEGVNAPDLLMLICAHYPANLDFSDEELESLFKAIDPRQFSHLAQALTELRDQLGGTFNAVFEAILPLADCENLSEENTPASFVFLTLERRPELIDLKTVARLSNSNLYNLLTLGIEENGLAAVLETLMRRAVSSDPVEVLELYPELSLTIGTRLSRKSDLNDEWRPMFRQLQEALTAGVSKLPDAASLVEAAHLLDFPMAPENAPSTWFTVFQRFREKLDSQSETTFLSYIFVLCAQNGIVKNQDIVSSVLPQLRERVLNGDLNLEATGILNKWLPSYRDGWDLNKRLLKVLRQAHKQGALIDGILNQLHLSDSEYAYATNQDPENLVRNMMRAFMPWSPWS